MQHIRLRGFRTLRNGGVAIGCMALAACFPNTQSTAAGNDQPGAAVTPGLQSVKVRGCKTDDGGLPSMAPNGYYTNGATVCAADGTPHLFHGVDRPSLEWSTGGDHIGPADFAAMAGWNANVVRIALNQDFWLSDAALADPGYPALVAQAVSWAEAAGLDVILDLHWSDRGDDSVTKFGDTAKQDTSGGSNQQQMADTNSLRFWTQLAGQFKNDGRVLFELYNEPNGIGWGPWLNGGMAAGFQVVGMQQLYDAIRGEGAYNVVIAGGLDWAFDLSQVGSNPINGFNVMYATHPYDQSGNLPGLWPQTFGYLATNDLAPVIVTEFGDGRAMCTSDWDTQLIQFADANQISWTAWAWYPAGCSFPAIISDWNYTPTDQGQVVKNALATYPKYVPTTAADGGLDAGDGGPASFGDASVDAQVEAPPGATSAGEAGDDAASSGDAGADATLIVDAAAAVEAAADASDASPATGPDGQTD